MKSLILCFCIVILIASAANASGAACGSSNGFILGQHLPRPSLGIRLFELKVRPEFPMRTMEELRIYLAESFRARLSESGYFSSVSILSDDSGDSTDFTMIGAFTQASIGKNDFSLYGILTQTVFDRLSAVTIVGGILRAGDPDPVTTFQCQLACCIPIPGTDIKAAHSGIGKSKASIAEMAKELEIVYRQMGISKALADSK